jgi:hypothetical protein
LPAGWFSPREWIQRDQLNVLFTPTFKLLTQLLAAKRDLSCRRRWRSLAFRFRDWTISEYPTCTGTQPV